MTVLALVDARYVDKSTCLRVGPGSHRRVNFYVAGEMQGTESSEKSREMRLASP
jgi:hypothetical protein